MLTTSDRKARENWISARRSLLSEGFRRPLGVQKTLENPGFWSLDLMCLIENTNFFTDGNCQFVVFYDARHSIGLETTETAIS